MSGGYFNYVQYRLSDVVDQIQELINNNNVKLVSGDDGGETFNKKWSVNN
jgi:hypothetical protein